MADPADEFAAWLTAEGRAANTVAAYRRDVVAYLRWRSAPDAPGDDALAAYVNHVRATRRPSSAARAVVALRIFHRWMDDAPGAPPLPELRGLPTRSPEPEPEPLSEAEIGRLLAAARGETAERRRDTVAVGLLYFAGLKATEAIALDVADVGPDFATLTVDRDGPHERLLPVVPALRDGLERWLAPKGRPRLAPASAAVLVNLRGQRLTRQGLWLLTGGVAKRAELADTLAPNDLRRACAAHLASHGIPNSGITAFLGLTRGNPPSVGMLNQSGWGSCNLTL